MTDYLDADTVSSVTTPIATAETTQSVDSTIISSKTTPSADERGPFKDTITVNALTTPSVVEVYGRIDAATITSRTTLSADERGPFTEPVLVQTITTAGAPIETVVTWTIDLAGLAQQGYALTGTITVGAVSVIADEAGDYVTPGGQWGAFDTDSGDML